MRRAAPILASCALVACSCAAAPPPEEGGPTTQAEVLLEPAEPVDAVEVEPSGRTLSGVFVETAARPPAVAWTWAFTASGGYARSAELGGGAVRRDSGSYTIDKSGRLVLYVEQRGEQRFTTAERFVCELEGDPATSLTIRSPEGWSATLVRTAAEPSSGEATSAAR